MPDLIAADLLDDLDVPHERDAPLAPLTWYKLGGRAAVLARPTSTTQLAALAARCHERGVALYVLGGGANLLVRDEGVPGVVVQLNDPAFTGLHVDGNRLRVGAGHDLFKLVLATARAGLAGLEVLAGIPGTVGGALRMNAGGAFGDIGACVRRVGVMSAAGRAEQRSRDELIFAYRASNIAAPLILDAEFELEEEDPQQLARRVKEIFFYKKTSQPMDAASAGCAFKNPPRDVADGAGAGQLIDRAGLKGYRHGQAQVSPVHANFIAADPGATAGDVLAVIDHVQRVVAERFGVTLEREVVVWP
ncbi:MAG: UDP-N-acetylmuramate dehydrogenase [Phycisphaeraceae bacterium]